MATSTLSGTLTKAAGRVVAVVHAGRSNLSWEDQTAVREIVKVTYRSILHMQALRRHWKKEFRSFMMQIHSASLETGK